MNGISSNHWEGELHSDNHMKRQEKGKTSQLSISAELVLFSVKCTANTILV
jgi:hypothetical protein